MCYKALLLLEHLVKHGPAKIVSDVQASASGEHASCARRQGGLQFARRQGARADALPAAAALRSAGPPDAL